MNQHYRAIDSSLPTKPVRNSSIELLRILAACAVVVLHYNGMGKALANTTGMCHELLAFLECLCVCSVALFIMISGYFLCKNDKRTWDKPVYLLVQLSVIVFFSYILSTQIGGGKFDLITAIHSIVPPKNYFVLLYVTLYIVSPFINLILNHLTSRGRTFFLMVLLALFAFYPTIIDSYQILIKGQPMGVSTVGAWGQQHGYTIVGFVLSYVIGAWLRLNEVGKSTTKRKILLLLVITVLCLYGWFKVEELFLLKDVSLIEYNALSYTNPLVLLLTALLMILFTNININSKLINSLAKATFVCYILHLQIIPFLNVPLYASMGGVKLFAHLTASVVFIYIFSWIIWWVLDVILKPINRWLACYSIYSLERTKDKD